VAWRCCQALAPNTPPAAPRPCSGGYLKRDGRPKDDEVLTSRLVDRPLRPMFPKGWSNDTQVLQWVLSYDRTNPPEPLAITAAGAALLLSGEPRPPPGRCLAQKRSAPAWPPHPTGAGGRRVRRSRRHARPPTQPPLLLPLPRTSRAGRRLAPLAGPAAGACVGATRRSSAAGA
jgi:hypothetical protein